MPSLKTQEPRRRQKQRDRRPLNEQEDEQNVDSPVSDNKGESPIEVIYEQDEESSFFGSLIDWDIELTAWMSVCVSPDAVLGRLRPLMIMLEWSGHGVPWFAWVILAIFISHEVTMLEILINMLMGKYY